MADDEKKLTVGFALFTWSFLYQYRKSAKVQVSVVPPNISSSS